MKKFLIASFGLASIFMACSGDDGASSGITTDPSGRGGSFKGDVLIKDGYFTDSRDGKEYKVVKIGNEYWFAENLQYVDSAKMKNLKGNVWCYDDDPKNCKKYGALYSWSAALNRDAKYNVESVGYGENPSFDVCPDGWTVPSYTQWQNLFEYVDIYNGTEESGTSLKSVKGWDAEDSIPQATNRFGFNGLAAGRRNSEGGFLPDGKNAYFWSQNEVDAATAKGVTLRYNKLFADHGDYYKEHGMSVRCIAKNNTAVQVEGDLDSSYIAEIPHEYGSMTVDSKKYKTIKIGEQTWMAENMNYKTGDSWCYNNESENCDELGRLYTWETAQKVCPEGWKLPNTRDIENLRGYHANKRFIRSVGGWKKDKGLNFWGFNAQAAGAYNVDNSTFYDRSVSAYFWSGAEDSRDTNMAWAFYISFANTDETKSFEKQQAFSVRCIKE